MKKDMSQTLPKIAKDRSQFRKLIAANPSHFYDLKKAVPKLGGPPSGNTTYEELICVGYQPALKLLHATVHVKLANGFLGELCGDGSMEFVQFYIDYGEGAGWQDVGYATFNTHDIPNFTDCQDNPDKPLSYVVTLPLEPDADCCNRPVLPKVRAILSWESPPTGPNDPIVWGNGLDRHIQIKPYLFCITNFIDVLFKDTNVQWKLPLSLKYLAANKIELPPPPELELPDMVELYSASAKGKGPAASAVVEPHRFGFKNMLSALNVGVLSPKLIEQKIAEWENLNLDWGSAVAKLDKTSGDTSYEELDCVGLDPNTDRLVATYRIKRSTGYSGDLCAKGSTEYVAFWADWDDTCKWTYLGTAEVAAHDISEIPGDDLHYAAELRVDLADFLESCEELKVGRVRAMLSWNTPPNPANPDAVPHWGNRLDVHVHIKPGTAEEGPHLSIIGGIGVAEISTASTGMTVSGARFALTGAFADPWLTSRPCPFGGQIVISGKPQDAGDRYRIMVRTVGGGTEQPVTEKIRTVDEYGNPTWRFADSDQAFTFLNDDYNQYNLLAWWNPDGNDLWEIRLQLIDGAANEVATSPWYRIQLDNKRPEAEISLDSGPCHQFIKTDPAPVVTGQFVAREPSGHFGAFSLDTLPHSVSPPNPSTATPTTSETAASPGDSWSLNTKDMQPCGYVVRVRVWDRTIVGSVQGHHNRSTDDVGFCLLAPEED